MDEGRWSWPLRARIFAVNLFAVLMFAGGVLYLDSYRGRLIDQRRAEVRENAGLAAAAFAAAPSGAAAKLAARLGRATGERVVLFRGERVAADSFASGGPRFPLRSPAEDPARRRIARALDRLVEGLAGTVQPPPFPQAWPGRPGGWPEVRAARNGVSAASLWRAPDRSDIVTAAAPVGGGAIVHLTADARDITFRVRDERLRSFRLFLFVLALTLALSWFLARTIAKPLRQLADAAEAVREGRAREVVVPRLPERRDEIGRLARALSDMTAALRRRIDATEAFAADVAHELKNPLASLRSALETSERVEDRATRAELRAVMADDVARMDRLLTAIADASRLDAEMSRARFVSVDLAAIARDIARWASNGVAVVASDEAPPARGDPDRLGQVVRNLVENAVGFSPPGGTVRVRIDKDGARWLLLAVEDDGPGVPPDALERIFDRFYTARPGGGRHSGLGLAIARAIVEAHGGRIWAENRPTSGARFLARLPRA